MAYPYLSDLLRALTGLDLPLPLPTFGLMVAVAFVVGTWVFELEVRRLRPDARPLVSNLATLGVVAGIVGARVFSILEHPHEFLADPWGQIFTRNGFTFYGGLLFAVGGGILYVRRHGLPVTLMLDAIAPTLILGYGLGRIGCQLAGDGDWGIAANLAAKPEWLPTWLWADTYTGNILGVVLPPPGVYPTPLYECALSLAVFAVLWALRRHTHRHGWLFSWYLVLAGLERLLIEQVRVNVSWRIAGFEVTQAEVIASACIVAGVVGLWRCAPRREPAAMARPGA